MNLFLMSRLYSLRTWLFRIISGLMMVSGYSYIILQGHVAMMALLVILMFAMFHEILENVFMRLNVKNRPIYRIYAWFLLSLAIFHSYVEFIIAKFHIYSANLALCSVIVHYSRLCVYSLYFVSSFGVMKFDSTYNMVNTVIWIHMLLIVVFMPGYVVFRTISKGVFFTVVGDLITTFNDIMALLFGKIIGNHPLIEISPKKTWEGFIGAAVSTIIFAQIIAYSLLHFYPILICPLNDDCSDIYSLVSKTTFLSFLGIVHIPYNNLLYHTLIISIFVAIIGPFGGFFASGMKRAFDVKDFGNFIPGHGGIVDRCDCMTFVKMFLYVYLHSFVFVAPDFDELKFAILRFDDVSLLQVFNLLSNKTIVT